MTTPTDEVILLRQQVAALNDENLRLHVELDRTTLERDQANEIGRRAGIALDAAAALAHQLVTALSAPL